MATLEIHPSITLEVVTEAVERSHSTLDNPGFCIACGAENDGVEPDAQGNECEMCGAACVHGAEELLMMLY